MHRLHRYLTDRFPLPWLITIVDNASTDGTWQVASTLAADLHEVQAMRPRRQGPRPSPASRLGASPAPVVAYMDVDLSTDLDALLPSSHRC
ncbi:MAG: hypothetical protein R2701_11860 [Acidimicrobiales bacterium]